MGPALLVPWFVQFPAWAARPTHEEGSPFGPTGGRRGPSAGLEGPHGYRQGTHVGHRKGATMTTTVCLQVSDIARPDLDSAMSTRPTISGRLGLGS